MSRVDTVVSPNPLGVARRQSLMWPGFQTFALNSFGPATDATSRQSDMGQANGFVLTTTGAPPAGQGGQVYKGRATIALTSGTNTGYTAGGAAAFISTQRSLGNVALLGNDDWAVWELSAILAFDTLPGAVNANGQIGLQFGSGNWTQPLFGTVPTQSGFNFGPVDAAGTFAVRSRTTDGGAVTTVGAGSVATYTEFHRYAIRLISASGANEAQAKFLVDGSVVLTMLWGAGTVLPNQVNTFVAPRLGFIPSITNLNYNAATSRMYVSINSVQLIAAPTEDALA